MTPARNCVYFQSRDRKGATASAITSVTKNLLTFPLLTYGTLYLVTLTAFLIS
jgi:hypothetical protein